MKTEQKIYLIRKMLGWSQEALGETHIRIDRLEALCKEWGITLQQLTSMDVGKLYDLIEEEQNLNKGAPMQ